MPGWGSRGTIVPLSLFVVKVGGWGRAVWLVVHIVLHVKVFRLRCGPPAVFNVFLYLLHVPDRGVGVGPPYRH
eukprot:5538111-Pyramimonas_sp.AAC.1